MEVSALGKKRPATLADVARRASVSTATVSRVLNGTANVIGSTRQSVLDAVRDLGYHPSASAQGLASGRTRTLGIVVFGLVPNFLSHELFYEIVQGIQEAASAADYDLQLYATRAAPDVSLCQRIAGKRQSDGLLVLGELVRPEFLAAFHTAGLPVVTVGKRDTGGLPIPCATADYAQGARLATEHLLRLGHRNIGAMQAFASWLPDVERLDGYTQALATAGIPFDPSLVVQAGGERQPAEQLAMEYLQRNPQVTAILAMSDVMALGVLAAATALGRRVPDDLALVGFGDIPSAALVQPPLTTVHLPKHELGFRGADLLLAMLRGEEVPLQTVLPTGLTVRNSCGSHG